MSAGVWIFLGLVVLAIAIFKGKSGGASGASKAPEETDLGKLFKQRDALAPEIVQECVRAAKALPIVDEKASPLLHDPVYDARVDQLDPPCKESGFGWSTSDCWLTPDTVGKVFEPYAEHEASFRLKLSRPRTDCVVAAGDHLDVLHCNYSVNEPGLNVRQLCRVAEDRWHVYYYRCGMGAGEGMGMAAGNMKIVLTSDADVLDPPLKAVDAAQDPTLWTKRVERLRSKWILSGHWRDALTFCTHRAKA